MFSGFSADGTSMRRVLCGVVLLMLGLAPAAEARRVKLHYSKHEQRRRYVAQPYAKAHKKVAKQKAPKAKWGQPHK